MDGQGPSYVHTELPSNALTLFFFYKKCEMGSAGSPFPFVEVYFSPAFFLIYDARGANITFSTHLLFR
jgi:hypothetical protein